jgi:nitrite reductase/ring-hydroxylating ferredoxin subunit
MFYDGSKQFLYTEQRSEAVERPHSHHRENAVAKRVELCKTDAVALGTALRVEAEGLTVAVFNLDGEFYVTDDACTHGPGSLSEGFIDGDVIECNFHNGQFDIKTGAVVAPPCMVPVKTYPTTVEGGTVFIEVD